MSAIFDQSKPIPPRSSLIDAMFRLNSAVCVFGDGDTGTRACEELAAELSMLQRRVVVVSVLKLVQMNPILHPGITGFAQGTGGKFWLWPPSNYQTLVLPSQTSKPAEDWFFALCRNFDSVLLDCPELQRSPECAPIAIMAESAVLAVEIGRTSKEQILRNQHILQATGMKIAGSLLIGSR
jgi:hypothetical protein